MILLDVALIGLAENGGDLHAVAFFHREDLGGVVPVNEQLRAGLIVRLGEVHLLGPLRRDGHRANDRVVLAGEQSRQNPIPFGRHDFDFTPQAPGYLARDIHVKAGQVALLVVIAERRVLARQRHAQGLLPALGHDGRRQAGYRHQCRDQQPPSHRCFSGRAWHCRPGPAR